MAKIVTEPKVLDEEVIEVVMPTTIYKTISGGSYSIIPRKGISMACNCGRSINISKETIDTIVADVDTEEFESPMRIKITECQYNTLNPGGLFVLKDNGNGHNYSLLSPIMKINNTYAVDICKNYSDGLHFGNTPPPKVYRIVSANRALIEAIPETLRNLIKVEEIG